MDQQSLDYIQEFSHNFWEKLGKPLYQLLKLTSLLLKQELMLFSLSLNYWLCS